MKASSLHMRLPKVLSIVSCLALGLGLAMLQSAKSKQKPSDLTPTATLATTISPIERLESLPAMVDDEALQKSYQFLRERAKREPGRVENWLNLGTILAQAQRITGETTYYVAAESVYREALKLKPNDVAAQSGMAWVTGGWHRFDESMNWARQALKTDPEHADAYGIIGDAELELGHYDAAFENYQTMIDLRPDLSSWSRGAHLLWLTGNVTSATSLMQHAILAGGPHPENTAWCRARLASMLFCDGATPAARAVIEPCLKQATKNPQVLLIAAKIAIAENQAAQAMAYYDTILLEKPNLLALIGKGELLESQGKLSDAEACYQKVEALHQSHLQDGTHDHSIMAKFYADHQRNLVEALRMVGEHKLTKNVLEADTLAWVYYQNQQLPEAIAAMKIALSQKTPDPEMHYHAGVIAMAYGDTKSARKHLEDALSRNPHFHVLHVAKATAMLHDNLQSNKP